MRSWRAVCRPTRTRRTTALLSGASFSTRLATASGISNSWNFPHQFGFLTPFWARGFHKPIAARPDGREGSPRNRTIGGSMTRRPRPVHKYKVGQMVDFVPSKTGVPASARSYKIVSLLPEEGGEKRYRIKTIAETFERTARESELLRTSSPV